MTDRGGNILVLAAEPSLEHPEEGEWRYVAGVVKKRIASLAIIVQSRNDARVQRDLSFDEIFLSSGKALLRLDPEQRIDAPSKLKTLPIMGVNIHLLRETNRLSISRMPRVSAS